MNTPMLHTRCWLPNGQLDLAGRFEHSARSTETTGGL